MQPNYYSRQTFSIENNAKTSTVLSKTLRPSAYQKLNNKKLVLHTSKTQL